jgi:hypothetical protein
MWNLVLVRSMMVLVSQQDRCTVCAKRTIGSEIILYTSVHLEIMLLGDEAQVETHFGPFRDRANLNAR